MEDYLRRPLDDERIQKIWRYYKDHIDGWINLFDSIYGKFFDDEGKPKKCGFPDLNNEFGVRIRNMCEAHQNGWIDPGNFFLLLNSVEESTANKQPKREGLILKLHGDEKEPKEPKGRNFFGVPSRTQQPALVQALNRGGSDLKQCPKDDKDKVEWFRSVCVAARQKNPFGAVQEALSEENDLFEQYMNGVSTMLFYMNPECFIPVNGKTKGIFKEKPTDAASYIELCKKIHEHQEELRKSDGYDDLKLFPIISAYYRCGENQVAELLERLKHHRNIILTGAPGTGKTYAVREYLKQSLEDEYDERVCWMQFHPNVEYADFIEGFRPVGAQGGQVRLELRKGVFKDFCKKAFKAKDKDFYFVIDEINRANLAAVFGEVLYAIEYRADANDPDERDFVDTPHTAYIQSLDDAVKKQLSVYEGKNECLGKFAVPSNLYIIGTMNDVDRSIDSFDLALRRRFVWKEMKFDEYAIRFFDVDKEKLDKEKLIRRARKLNDELKKIFNGDTSYTIGHAYFMKIRHYMEDENPYQSLWNYHLKPLIREYLRSELPAGEIDKKLEELCKEFMSDPKGN